MAKFSLMRPTNHPHRQHLFLRDLELLEPPHLLSAPSFPGHLHPFLRGPIYSTYAELRDRKRRVKRARQVPLTPIPSPLKRPPVSCSVSRSLAFSKENRKPSPASGVRFDAFMTPPPPKAPKPCQSKPVNKFSAARSYPDPSILKEISTVQASRIEEGKCTGGRSRSDAILRKRIASSEG